MKLLPFVAAASYTLALSGIIVQAAPVKPLAKSGHPTVAPSSALGFKFRAGRTDKYRLVMRLNGTVSRGGGKAIPLNRMMDFLVTESVKSVDRATGIATIESNVILEKTSMSVNGQTVSQGPGVGSNGTYTEHINSTGNVSSVFTDHESGAGLPAGCDGVNSALVGTILFPSKPVSIGNTWSFSTSDEHMNVGYKTVYRLTGLSTASRDQMATIYFEERGTPVKNTDSGKQDNSTNEYVRKQTTLFDNTLGLEKSITSSTHMVIVSAVSPPPSSSTTGSAAPAVQQKSDMTQTLTMTLLSTK